MPVSCPLCPPLPLHIPPPGLCREEGQQSHSFLLCVCTELLKDKNKPAVPARARGPRGRKRRPGEAEEAAAPELQASSLETCKGLLASILTHWGPVFPSPEPTREPMEKAAPKSDALGLVSSVASLVVSWVLRSVAERPLGTTEAAGLLGWLQSHILPHPEVVADLLKDSAVKSGMFKLHSQVCSTQGLLGPELPVACLSNVVMLRLVAALGPTGSPFHPPVETLCLSSLNCTDEATRGSAGARVRGMCGLGAAGTLCALGPFRFLLKCSGGPSTQLQGSWRVGHWALKVKEEVCAFTFR